MKILLRSTKHCPVCDRAPYLRTYPMSGSIQYQIYCPKCRRSTKIYDSIEEAREEWKDVNID